MDDPARHGAQQPNRFNPASAARLDDPARFAYLPVTELLAALELDRAATLLDFGAGTGAYAVAFARERPDVRILALDEQAEMLALLRANVVAAAVTNVEAIDSAQLSRWAGHIDRIFALNVLHELGDAALVGMNALPLPGGFALFVDWNADVERPHGPPQDHVYGVRRARERLASHGWSVNDVRLFPYHYALRCTPEQRGGRG